MSREHGTTADSGASGVATGRVGGASGPSDEHRRLDVFIGRWINGGQTAAPEGSEPLSITASDVYEWLPGGFFVLHTAHGRIGDIPVGAVEIIGFNTGTGQYRSHLFDSQGNATTHELSYRDGRWMWQGEHARCTARFTDDGRLQRAHHERLDDSGQWVPSMDVTLFKVP